MLIDSRIVNPAIKGVESKRRGVRKGLNFQLQQLVCYAPNYTQDLFTFSFSG
jgi:hypothetical protein